MALNNGVYVYAFNAIRNTGAFFLTYLSNKAKSGSKSGTTMTILNCDRNLIFWSCVCGVTNALGMTCSAVSLAYLNTAMFSFLLGLTVVMTPLLAHFLPFKSTQLNSLGWLAVAVSIIGTLVLEGCAQDMGACFARGNWYSAVALGAAFFYSLYAYLIGLGCEKVDASVLTEGTLLVSCITLCMILVSMLVLTTETNADTDNADGEPSSHRITWILTPWQLTCVAGVAALGAVAWQCETWAVVSVGASKAAMAIATEAPMTTLLAFLFLHEQLSAYQYFGCGLVFLAAVIAVYDTGGEEGHGTSVDSSSSSSKRKKSLSTDNDHNHNDYDVSINKLEEQMDLLAQHDVLNGDEDNAL